MALDVFRDVHCLMGLPFDAVDMPTAVARVRAAAAGRVPCFLTTPNLNFLVACRRDESFRNSVIESDLCIADGMPLVWIARLLGVPLPGRVSGADLFDELRACHGEPISVYLFGGPPGVAARACERLNAERGGVRCVGFESPGFGSIEEMSSPESIDRINASAADFVVVALGARKGQAWIQRNRARLDAQVVSHLGAVLNFVAGTVNRSPVLLQRIGLEWLWRIKEEPVLWRRYLGDGAALLELLATRILPYTWYQWRHRQGASRGPEAGLETSRDGQGVVIRLSGSWRAEVLAPLRTELAEAAAAGRDVVLDIGKVSYVESAFVGLVLLLDRSQSTAGKVLRIEGTSPAILQVLRYCGADFLEPSTSTLAAVEAKEAGSL